MPNLRTINLTLTKEDLKKSLKRDILIVQTIRSYDNLEKIKGMLNYYVDKILASGLC